MDSDNARTTYFRYCRDFNGRLLPIDVAVQNGRVVPRFPPSVTEPTPHVHVEEESAGYRELKEEVMQNLNPVECRTFLLIHEDGYSIAEVAETEKTSRQAIYSRLQRMIRKNDYCKISATWGRLRKKVNQHK
jgi:DNA-directed RNA polymerase specialized sigma24 family protein